MRAELRSFVFFSQVKVSQLAQRAMSSRSWLRAISSSFLSDETWGTFHAHIPLRLDRQWCPLSGMTAGVRIPDWWSRSPPNRRVRWGFFCRGWGSALGQPAYWLPSLHVRTRGGRGNLPREDTSHKVAGWLLYSPASSCIISCWRWHMGRDHANCHPGL